MSRLAARTRFHRIDARPQGADRGGTVNPLCSAPDAENRSLVVPVMHLDVGAVLHRDAVDVKYPREVVVLGLSEAVVFDSGRLADLRTDGVLGDSLSVLPLGTEPFELLLQLHHVVTYHLVSMPST